MKFDGQLGSIYDYPSIPKWLDRWNRHIQNHPGFWIKLGQFENKLLEPWLYNININQPIYITGYARAGSTLILHLLDQCSSTTSFRYQHFPFVHTLWFWSWLTRPGQLNPTQLRAHQDRIKVSPQSPEGLDAMIWHHYAYQADLDTERVQAFQNLPDNFFSYYDNTIRKLLYLQNATRYLSKNNALTPHLRQLWQYYPQAKIIVTVRHPYDQIASLIKQHRLLSGMQQYDPSVLYYMRGMRHFEFGLDRRPLSLKTPYSCEDITEKWRKGQDIEGYAMQWTNVYGHLYKLKQQPDLQDKLFIVPYEQLCAHPETTLDHLGHWLNLDTSSSQHYARGLNIAQPDYYHTQWSMCEKQRLSALVGDVATNLGYKL